MASKPAFCSPLKGVTSLVQRGEHALPRGHACILLGHLIGAVRRAFVLVLVRGRLYRTAPLPPVPGWTSARAPNTVATTSSSRSAFLLHAPLWAALTGRDDLLEGHVNVVQAIHGLPWVDTWCLVLVRPGAS